MGTGGPFPGGKARPGLEADHSPLSSAEVVNEKELYLLSPQAPPWRVEGLLLLFLIFMKSVITTWKTNKLVADFKTRWRLQKKSYSIYLSVWWC
jgi:hypothetical protein